MPKHLNQRVGVFVDIQNMYYSAKQFYNSKVNFAYILNRAVSGRKLVRAIAYVIKADIKEEENFFEALEKIGYDVRSKDLQTFFGGAKKGDWDVGIAMDIMRMASKLDVIVLVSGDGDFKDLVEHVKALGCRAEVIAFKKTASSRILNEADEFIDLDKELDKVLIRHENNYEKYEKDFNKNYNKDFKKNFRKNFKAEFKKVETEKPNLIQKLNMEQPDLNKDESILEKKVKPEINLKAREDIKKSDENKQIEKKKSDDKTIEEKKTEDKKSEKKKTKNVFKSVISKVTGKKE